MKKFLIKLLILIIVASNLYCVPIYASVFADINNVPWSGSEKYIEEAYNLGLMVGYVENGQRYCKANNNVTYCEAVQLMYTIMSKCSNTTVSSSVVNKWTNIMTAKNIPSWAYNAVAYGLENEILSQNDISIFMTSSSSQNNAKREDIAVIFGKALGKVYNTSLNPTLNYLDANEISKTSVPYVHLLNSLNIMVGDAKNYFKPKSNINKAEMAVIVSNTYSKLCNVNFDKEKDTTKNNSNIVYYNKYKTIPDFGYITNATLVNESQTNKDNYIYSYQYDTIKDGTVGTYTSMLKDLGFNYDSSILDGNSTNGVIRPYVGKNYTVTTVYYPNTNLFHIMITDMHNNSDSNTNTYSNNTSNNNIYYPELDGDVPDFGKITGAKLEFKKRSDYDDSYGYSYVIGSFTENDLNKYLEALDEEGFGFDSKLNKPSTGDSATITVTNHEYVVTISVNSRSKSFFVLVINYDELMDEIESPKYSDEDDEDDYEEKYNQPENDTNNIGKTVRVHVYRKGQGWVYEEVPADEYYQSQKEQKTKVKVYKKGEGWVYVDADEA